MLGCVYLILAALLGREIIRNFLPEQRMREKGITPLWVTFAASFGSGVLLMTWAVYIAAWLLSVYSEAEEPPLWSKSDGDGSCGDIFALVLL